jgi:hypothetical protein
LYGLGNTWHGAFAAFLLDFLHRTLPQGLSPSELAEYVRTHYYYGGYVQ